MGGLDSLRNVGKGLHPALREISVTARALIIGSATKLIEIAGGGPAVARVGDFVVRFWLQSPGGGAPDVLWYSTSTAEPYTWTPLTSSAIAPTIHNGGTAITITTGSARVTCG